MKLTIETANTDDLDNVVRWCLQLHQHEDDGRLPTHPEFAKNIRQWLSNEIDNPNSLIIVARDESTPVGFLSATCQLNQNGLLATGIKGVIQMLWIDTSYRKQGVARTLIDLAEQTLRESGAHYIECTHTEVNESAGDFWRRLGYEPYSTLRIKRFN